MRVFLSIVFFVYLVFNFCLWDFRKTSDRTTDRLCFAWLLLRRRLKIYLLYLTDSVCCSDGWCGWEWMDESEWLNWVKWMVSDESLSVYAARHLCISNNTFLCCVIFTSRYSLSLYLCLSFSTSKSVAVPRRFMLRETIKSKPKQLYNSNAFSKLIKQSWANNRNTLGAKRERVSHIRANNQSTLPTINKSYPNKPTSNHVFRTDSTQKRYECQTHNMPHCFFQRLCFPSGVAVFSFSLFLVLCSLFTSRVFVNESQT